MTISITDAMIEAGARALATKYCGDPDELAHRWNPGLGALEQQAHPNWQDYAEDVRFALTAAVAAAPPPDPMVVPLRMEWVDQLGSTVLCVGGMRFGVLFHADGTPVWFAVVYYPRKTTEHPTRDAAMRALENAVRLWECGPTKPARRTLWNG